MDILALDWFNENPVSSELRIYFVDKLLPTLVLGLEKVCNLFSGFLGVS